MPGECAPNMKLHVACVVRLVPSYGDKGYTYVF